MPPLSFHSNRPGRVGQYFRKAWFHICLWAARRSRRNTLRLGSDYGGWTLCPDAMTSDSIVYSIGIGEDISFDLSLIEKYNCCVFAFDPTPRSIRWLRRQALPSSFVSFALGVANYDGEASFFPPENPEFVSHTMLQRPVNLDKVIKVPVKRLHTIMNDLKHNRIDLLKMDIEGAEYEVIDDILSAKLDIRQLLVEFHIIDPGATLYDTIRSVIKLWLNGYRLFSISSSGKEYSFLRMPA